MQNLVRMKKSGILYPDSIGKPFKPNLDSFIDDSSDDLLSVYVKISFALGLIHLLSVNFIFSHLLSVYVI